MSDFDHFTGTQAVSAQQAFDVTALSAWLERNLDGFCGPATVESFKGGQSNPTYKLSTPTQSYVIRAKPGVQPHPERHHHEVEFQMVYVLKGWVKFHYEGVGDVTLKAGSCVHQPPGIKHTELVHSDDLELIEIVMPADFRTVND